MLVPIETHILTIKGYRPLYSLPQGVPIIVYDEATKRFKTIPLAYNIKSAKNTRFKRVRVRQEFEQYWNNKWVAAGGCNYWYTIDKFASVYTKDGFIPLKEAKRVRCVDSSPLVLEKTDYKRSKKSINDQLGVNLNKVVTYDYGSLNIGFKDLVKSKSSISRPTAKGQVIEVINPTDNYHVVEVNHQIITFGLILM